MDGEYLELRGEALEELCRALLVEQDSSRALKAELARRDREIAELRRELAAARAWDSLPASRPEDGGAAREGGCRLQEASHEVGIGDPNPSGQDVSVGRSQVSEGPGFREIAIGDSLRIGQKAHGLQVWSGAELTISGAASPAPGRRAALGGPSKGSPSPDAEMAAALRAQNALLGEQLRSLRRQALQAGTAVKILSAGFTSSLSAFADAAARISAVSRRIRKVEQSVARLLRLQRARRR